MFVGVCMKKFFELEPGIFHFKLFGFWHILMTVVTIISIILIYTNREKIRKWKYHDKPMRYLIAFTMFLNMTVYYLSKIVLGTYDIRVHLPLHFCFISGYLFMFLLVINRKKMFKYVYFFSYAGPLPAIILPDLICGPDRFIFWQFFISHHFFIISSMYVLFVLDYKITRKDALKSILYANVIFGLVFIFNQVFHTNYIMTSTLPAHILKLMPFLKYFDFPIIWLELAGIIAFMIAYIPLYFWNKKKL